MGKHEVEGVGRLLIWDCAGQREFHLTHGMLFGSQQSIFIVLYDLRQPPQVSHVCLKGVNRDRVRFCVKDY